MHELIIKGVVYPVSSKEEDYIFDLDIQAKKSANQSKCTKIKRATFIVYPELKDSHNQLKIISSGINKPVNGINGYCKQCPVGKKNFKGNIVKTCKLSVLAEEDAIMNFLTAVITDKSSKQIINGNKILYNFKYDSHENFRDGLEPSSAYSFPDYGRVETLIRLNIHEGVYRLFGVWYNVNFPKLIEYSSNPKNKS